MISTLRLLSLFTLGLTSSLCAAEAPASSLSNRISYDSCGLKIDGQDIFIYSGSFHYFRCPKPLWRDRFQKLKEAGFNCVETYVPWNWHERTPPASPSDFSHITGMQDLDDWLTMAEQFGFYVIIRPGPYICSEWAGGGFPQWLVALEKPHDWAKGTSWLQTDAPSFVAWSNHWYEAACPVIAKHQITRKPPGSPGVILFQIENEYARLHWLPHSMRKRYLESLAVTARREGIDVPIFTCYTDEARGVKAGPLLGVFDMMNYYPGWAVQKQLDDRTAMTRPQQPEAPAMSAELQASGPVERYQNLTLYEVQLGYSLINYYMAFGGTNFDDWAGRGWTTSYDMDAIIRENGGVDEKFRVTQGIAALLRQHGVQIMRGHAVALEVKIADSAVQIAEREAQDGSRYFFVRTNDRDHAHAGTAQVTEKEGGARFTVDYHLGPFGSLVLYVPPGETDANKGEWFPKPGPAIARPAPQDLPSPIAFTSAESFSDPLPTQWTKLLPGDLLEKHGVFNYHPIYYRLSLPAGKPFSVGRLGDKVVNNTPGDIVVVMADGHLLTPIKSDKAAVTFVMPATAHEVFILQENHGLHFHTNPNLEEHWDLGITGVKSGDETVPLEFASTEDKRGLSLSDPKTPSPAFAAQVKIGTAALPTLLTWYRLHFDLPTPKNGIWFSWQLHIEALGNGFIYLNGHCIGRIWEIGPQRDFFLPACWLNFGPGQANEIAVSLSPLDHGVAITAASIAPNAALAERR